MKKRKDIVCDASSLISLTDGCFMDILYTLHKRHHINFHIDKSVKSECIDRPLNIKKYSMSAVRLLDALQDEILNEIDINVNRKIKEIQHTANKIYYAKGKPMHLVDKGEAGMIAIANDMKINNVLMDERTTRMLIEAPDLLRKHLEKELHVHIGVNEDNLYKFQDMTKYINVFRSSELVMLAYDKGMFKRYQTIEIEALRAALYKIKFSGCAVSFNEIDQAIALFKR